jgi:hypothetical protein
MIELMRYRCFTGINQKNRVEVNPALDPGEKSGFSRSQAAPSRSGLKVIRSHTSYTAYLSPGGQVVAN